ncbi:hypothetical protein HNR63_002369 [Anoxybacillus kamchatkensis]|nr:hypothetical protein [Anoxybacillus ayderensis]
MFALSRLALELFRRVFALSRLALGLFRRVFALSRLALELFRRVFALSRLALALFRLVLALSHRLLALFRLVLELVCVRKILLFQWIPPFSQLLPLVFLAIRLFLVLLLLREEFRKATVPPCHSPPFRFHFTRIDNG